MWHTLVPHLVNYTVKLSHTTAMTQAVKGAGKRPAMQATCTAWPRSYNIPP